MANLSYIKNNLLFNFQDQSSNSKTDNMIQVFVIPFEWVINNEFGSDESICFDCDFSQSKTKNCYVRKGFSNIGLLSKIDSLHKNIDKIPYFSSEIEEKILKMCQYRYIRFGAYGEPILMGEKLVTKICAIAKGWTGYTHQWALSEYNWSKKFFMASVEGKYTDKAAQNLGFRTYLVTQTFEKMENYTNCPASKEMGKISTCRDCQLCSGTDGKGKKNVIIKKH
jgi:hypothetical protein